LSQQALELKHEHPDAEDASVLAEPRIPYDDVIQVMDAIRGKQEKMFTKIAVGDAP